MVLSPECVTGEKNVTGFHPRTLFQVIFRRIELAVLGLHTKIKKTQLERVDDELSLGHSEFCVSAEHPDRNRKQKTENVGPVYGGKFRIRSLG